MNKKIIKLISTGVLMLGVGTTVYATAPGFYVGGSFGKSYVKNKKQTVQVGGPPPTGTTTLDPANTGIGERIYAGFDLNKYFGVEAGFTHYAPSTYTVSPTPVLTAGNPVGDPAITSNGFDIVGKLMYPIFTSGFAVFGKAGAAFIRQSKAGTFTTSYSTTQGGFVVATGTSTFVRPTFAIGASYDLSQNWMMDLTASEVTGGSGIQESALISLGISYHIVDKYCGQFLC